MKQAVPHCITHHCTIVVMHPKIYGEHALTILLSTQLHPHLYHFFIAEQQLPFLEWSKAVLKTLLVEVALHMDH